MDFPICEPDSFFNSDTLRISLRLAACITLPINFVAFYCIAYKSPSAMQKTYKWLLINCQFWSLVWDLLASVLITPVFYLPVWGGYSIGLLRTLGVPTSIQTEIAMIAAIYSLFEHRHHCVTRKDSCFYLTNKTRLTIFLILLIFYETSVLSMFLRVPEDQDAAKREAIERLGCIPEAIFTSAAYIFDRTNRTIVTLFLLVAISLLIGSFFCSRIYYSLQKSQSHMSAKTRQQQKQFFYSLFFQILMPILFVAVPLVCVFFFQFFGLPIKGRAHVDWPLPIRSLSRIMDSPTPAAPPRIYSSKATQAKEASLNGWDYWSRVYNDENSRNLPMEQAREMRISDLLSSETLVRAKLVFLNVPGLPTGYKNILLQLIKRELKEDLPIQGIVVQPGKWFINFYRPEDALKVMKAFNGYNYRSHTLVVRYCNVDGTYGDEATLVDMVKSGVGLPARIAQPTQAQQENVISVWNKTEREGLQHFERELTEMLTNSPMVHYQNALTAIRVNLVQKKLPSYFISDAIVQWSTGLLRLFSKDVKMLGNFLCLTSSAAYAQRIRDSAKQGFICTTVKDSWEPYLPLEVRSEVQLRDYVEAFLLHFGPQNIKIDIPFRILLHILPGLWPKTVPELAECLQKISSRFVVINHVLYISTSEKHYEHIIDNLASFQYDSEDSLDSEAEVEYQQVDVTPFALL
ncbi:unnamed protein product [Caenorhabditis auriculariae]|uniref:RRM domain-containing protein n=1 Tax=Caenorhabditis auriculariae TaxID=2777116 RepID=A0A8S1GQN4_9PELO|nr:unnamed protein product [Caenorhabditis auriculariae]